LILVQIGFFIFLFVQNFSSLRTSEIDYGILRKYGALTFEDIRDRRGLWRFFASIFIHGSSFHLFINVAFEFIFVLGWEEQWNLFRIGFLFFFSTFCGSLYTVAFNRDFCVVGPSSGMFGVSAAFLILFTIVFESRHWNHRIRYFFLVLLICFVLLSSGNQQRIDNFGHGGGFLFGGSSGCLIFTHKALTVHSKNILYLVGSFPIVLVMIIHSNHKDLLSGSVFSLVLCPK
jgi:membrane associated rhomboid family serine protease